MSPADALLARVSAWLRTLPRQREDVAEARARFAALRAEHPDVTMHLSVDRRPGWPLVEYDVLVEHPEGGTVGLTWRADDGIPWAVQHADHWSSNLVVTVGAGSVTVQEAFLFLKMHGERQPDLLERVVEEKIVQLEIEAAPPPVDASELQAAADTFRRANGLLSVASMDRRLAEWGITLARFETLLREAIQRRKFREAVVAKDLASYFEAHRHELERIRYLAVRLPTRALADRVAAAAREVGLPAAAASVAEEPAALGTSSEHGASLARDLPAEVASAAVRALVGPIEWEGRWALVLVAARTRAELDDETRAAVERVLWRRWIEEKRRTASVEWHWM